MTQSDIEALLGRPLTPNEINNLDLYLEIAQESLEELLCMSLDSQPDDSSDPEQETRTFDIREGYSTVFTDIFTDVTEVKVDGVVTTDFKAAFWDRRSSPYYNSIVLGECDGKTVDIKAYWGFAPVPSDLRMLWAQLFANISKKYVAGGGNIKRKAVEDFSVWYGELTDDQAFLDANYRTIKKYTMCGLSYIRHGKVCHEHGVRDCGHCI